MTLKELYAEKEKLNKQIRELEDAAREEKKKQDMSNHEKYVGKCYMNKVNGKNFKNVEAFKILSLSKYFTDKAVTCLCLSKDVIEPISIFKKDLWLWSSSVDRMISYDSDPIVLELYKEIDENTFDEIFARYIEELQSE